MKRQWKRGMAICAVGAMLLSSLTGCEFAKSESGDACRIVTTVFPTYDFAKEIACEDAEVTMLLSPGAESHAYEPTAMDLLKIQQCDVFVYIGGTSEIWVDKVLKTLDTSKVKVLRMFDVVDPLEEETVEGMEPEEHDHDHDHAEDSDAQDAHDEHDEHEEAEYDEHVWTSPANASKMAEAMHTAIASSDEKHKTEIDKRYATLSESLKKLEQDCATLRETAASDTLIFGDRFPFRYLTQSLGLRYYAAFPGCSSETEPSAATVSFLIQKVQDSEIPYVLYTESSTRKIADRIAEATRAKTAMLHSCNNVTKAEMEANVTYVSLMQQNLDTLRTVLGTK